MARFSPKRVHFGMRPADEDAEDEGEGLPTAKTIRVKARRVAGIREAQETLGLLPGPGEALHAICTHRIDMTDVFSAYFLRNSSRRGAAGHRHAGNESPERTRVEPGGWTKARSANLLYWCRGSTGPITRPGGSSYTPPCRNGTRPPLSLHRISAVMTLQFASGRYVIEGSANLCSNGSSREQFIQEGIDAEGELYSSHRRWILEMVTKYAPATDSRHTDAATADRFHASARRWRRDRRFAGICARTGAGQGLCLAAG